MLICIKSDFLIIRKYLSETFRLTCNFLGASFMRYEVIIEGYNPLIEEEIDVNVNGTKLKCFMPYGTDFFVEEGRKYYSEIEGILFDELIMNEICAPVQKIEIHESDFSHKIFGYLELDEGVIHSSIDVYLDMEYLCDYAYLDGKFVEIIIDRFNIEFV